MTFQPAPGLENLEVTFDERPVPANALTKRFSIDPGDHTVHAEGCRTASRSRSTRSTRVGEGQLLTVPLVLKSQAPEYLTPGQLKCMLGAKNQDDVLKCLPQKTQAARRQGGHAAVGLLGHDARRGVEPRDRRDGVVAHAGLERGRPLPRRRRDRGVARHRERGVAALPRAALRRRARRAGTSTRSSARRRRATTARSRTTSRAAAALALTADLNDKLITPRLGANYNHDSIGRGPNNFISTLDTTELEGGVTLVLSPTSLLLVSATRQFERGDQSKPYRYVPMFDPTTVAPYIPAGASVDLVNRVRLPVRPDRAAPARRATATPSGRASRTASRGATLRIEQRLYTDSWALKATTTDGRYVIDLGRHLGSGRTCASTRRRARTSTSSRTRPRSTQTRAARHPALPHDRPRALAAGLAHRRRRRTLLARAPRKPRPSSASRSRPTPCSRSTSTRSSSPSARPSTAPSASTRSSTDGSRALRCRLSSLLLAAAAAPRRATSTPCTTSAVNALGPEAADIPQGQYHRAGQPCVVCHGDEGPANKQFSIAGHGLLRPGQPRRPPVGVGNVTVQLEDDSQSQLRRHDQLRRQLLR